MTGTPASTLPRVSQDPRTSRGVTTRRVVVSEWTKFRSLRSSVYTLIAAVAFLIGLGALIAAVTAAQPGGFEPGQSAVATSLTGTFFAQLAVGVLGVLLISGEYSTGMIRSSLTVVPRRLPVLWAKLAVLAVAVFATMLAAATAAFFVGQAVLSSKHLDASIFDPGALRAVVGAALYLTVAAIIAMAVGALLRNTAASITVFVAVFFVIPPLTLLLPASVTGRFTQYLPSTIGGVLTGGSSAAVHALSPWIGFAVLCGYAVVLIGIAGWRLRRADA